MLSERKPRRRPSLSPAMTEQYLYHLWMHVPIHHMCASHMSEIVPAKAREASQSEFLLEGMRQIGHVSWSFTINSVELAASGRGLIGDFFPHPPTAGGLA